MKKIDKKGFTLIELLAVIVILAILMITAIPAVTNSIAKSRKDTFATNAKNVINAVRTSMASGDVKNGSEECSYPADGSAVKITITSDALKGLLERGGDKSSFGRAYNDSYVIIYNKGGDKFDYYIAITDKGGNGVATFTKESALTGSNIKLGNAGNITGTFKPEGSENALATSNISTCTVS